MSEDKKKEIESRDSKIIIDLTVSEDGKVKTNTEISGYTMDLMESLPNIINSLVSVCVEHMVVAGNADQKMSEGDEVEMRGMIPVVIAQAAGAAIKLRGQPKVHKSIVIPGRS